MKHCSITVVWSIDWRQGNGVLPFDHAKLRRSFRFVNSFKICIFCLGAILILRKGKGMGGIAKYLLFLTGVGGWFGSPLCKKKRLN